MLEQYKLNLDAVLVLLEKTSFLRVFSPSNVDRSILWKALDRTTNINNKNHLSTGLVDHLTLVSFV